MPVVKRYQIGDAPVIVFTCRAIQTAVQLTAGDPGTLTDPTALVAIVDPEAAAPATFTYGSSTELTKTSTGVFALAVPTLAIAGLVQVNAKATGALTAADQSSFIVDASNV